MDRKEYFILLEKELKKRNVSDYQEIISDYEDLLNEKINDGYFEKEVLDEWGHPSNIALQFNSSYKESNDTSDISKKPIQPTTQRKPKVVQFVVLQVLNIFLIPILIAIFFASLSTMIIPAILLFTTVLVFVIGLGADTFNEVILSDLFGSLGAFSKIAIVILFIFIVAITFRFIFTFCIIYYRIVRNYVVYNINLIKSKKIKYKKLFNKFSQFILFLILGIILYGTLFSTSYITDYSLKPFMLSSGEGITEEYVIHDEILDIDVDVNSSVKIIHGKDNKLIYTGKQKNLNYSLRNGILEIDNDGNIIWDILTLDFNAGELVIELNDSVDSIIINGVDINVNGVEFEDLELNGVDVYVDVKSRKTRYVDINSVDLELSIEDANRINEVNVDTVDMTLDLVNSNTEEINIDAVDATTYIENSVISYYEVNAVNVNTNLLNSLIKNYDVDAVQTTLNDE